MKSLVMFDESIWLECRHTTNPSSIFWEEEQERDWPVVSWITGIKVMFFKKRQSVENLIYLGDTEGDRRVKEAYKSRKKVW